MLNSPVVASTVPVTWLATAATSGSWRIFAACTCTAVLPSSCTGSGSETWVLLWLLCPVWSPEMVDSWISAVDSYFGVWIFE